MKSIKAYFSKRAKEKRMWAYHALQHALVQGDIDWIKEIVESKYYKHDEYVQTQGGTPIWTASILQQTSKEILDYLVYERGISVDHQNKVGNTALMIASRDCSVDVVRTLLSYGANPRLRNEKGASPVNLAFGMGKLHMIFPQSIPRRIEIIDLLLAAGGDKSELPGNWRGQLENAHKNPSPERKRAKVFIRDI